MYKHEEEKLQYAKKELDEHPIPESLLDDAILAGMKRGKVRTPMVNRYSIFIAAAVVLITVFISSIRVSDAFADYVTKIPGMEKIVELVRTDKGLTDAIQNEFVQKVNVSDEHDGLIVTIDSVIVDEQQMVVFYEFETNGKHRIVSSSQLKLTDQNGNTVPASFSFNGEHDNLQEVKKGVYKTVFQFVDPLNTESLLLTFKLQEGEEFGEGKELPYEWKLPFTVTKESYVNKKKEFQVNQSVEVEGQKITIKNVTILPTRVGVTVKFDPNNTKQIFAFEDLRLVDENGEAWTAISNGVIASHISKNEHVLYLQSNYFKEPEQLFLQFSTLRALNKDELTVVVDPTVPKIIEAPKDNRLFDVQKGYNQLIFMMKKDKVDANRGYIGMFDHAIDSAGKAILPKEPIGSSSNGDNLEEELFIPYDAKEAAPGFITLEIYDYPARITENVKIKLK